MINLLPEEYYKVADAEYRHRRRVVRGAFILAWLLMLALVISSAYWAVRSRRLTYSNLLAAKKSELAAGQSDLSAVSFGELMESAAIFTKIEKNRILPMAYLERVLSARSRGIHLESFLFTGPAEKSEPRLEIVGSAANRRNLLDFLDRLRADKFFSSVESPVSNLIKDNDVPFNLTLRLNAKHE